MLSANRALASVNAGYLNRPLLASSSHARLACAPIDMNLIAATLLLVDVVLAGNLELLLLHNNDMHARFDETTSSSGTCAQADRPTCIGGFARVAHLVREAKRKQGTGRQVLFLNAGDTYTGTAWFAVHKWKIARDFLNMLDIDVMVSKKFVQFD